MLMRMIMRELKFNMNFNKKKVVLGFSGGVDSTTAALLLKKQGYEVIGFFFNIFNEDTDTVNTAKKVANELGIKLIIKNVSSCFNDIVKENFCNEYIKGRTPNPCIICNPNIKFKELINGANEENAYYIATGHYARTYEDESTGDFYIRKASNEKKDQSYMLHRLQKDVISRLILPLGEIFDKEITRNIARDNNLTNADQKDSQEICFIDKDDNYVNYIKSKGYKPRKGNFVNLKGDVLGQHQGLINYTIGQRKGLGITFGKPQYVIRMDSLKNEVVLGDNEDLFTDEVISINNNFATSTNYEGVTVIAKIRYAAKGSSAVLHYLDNDRVLAKFNEKQRAVTPGQSIVFYLDDLVIGGGFID